MLDSDDGEFSTADFRRTEKVPASDGKFYETSIYNLEVLNKLGMCCFRGNKKAKEIRHKFNDVLVKRETGVTQAQLAELYRSSVQNVGHHIGNILEDEELQADSTIKESFIVQLEGWLREKLTISA